MNINKVIAVAIFLATFLGPFYMLFIVDTGVNGIGDIFMLLLTIAGFFAGFAVGTNEPFGRKKVDQAVAGNSSSTQRHREAA